MDILLKILMMFSIAFAISMFVAFVIWALNGILSNVKNLTHIRYPSISELRRAERIRRLKRKELKSISREIEERQKNELIEFYNGH
jgi:hypothetical protein